MSEDNTAGVFSRAASTYDRVGPPVFEHLGRRLVEMAQIPGGATVLDVATGRGAILFPAAEQAGSCGRAIGVDLATGMVRAVAADVRRLELGQAAICQADAEHLPFPAALFDYVLCGNSIFFFPQATIEFYRVLRIGGRVGITIVAKGCFDWLIEAFERYQSAADSLGRDMLVERTGPAVDTPDGLGGLLSAAGFKGVNIADERTDFVYANEETWWATLWTLGFRGAMEKMAPSTLEAFRSDVFQRLQPFKRTDGIHILFRVLFARGAK